MAKNPNEVRGLQFRIPEWLREKIEAAARANEQSMNTEMLSRMSRSFDDERQNLDYRAMVSALSGGGENAQLLSMLASALQLATSHSKDKSSPGAMDTFLVAMNLIVRAHSGRPVDPVNATKVLDMPEAERHGYMIADAILDHYDLPRPIYISPEEQKEINEYEASGMTLANLGRPNRGK